MNVFVSETESDCIRNPVRIGKNISLRFQFLVTSSVTGHLTEDNSEDNVCLIEDDLDLEYNFEIIQQRIDNKMSPQTVQ